MSVEFAGPRTVWIALLLSISCGGIPIADHAAGGDDARDSRAEVDPCARLRLNMPPQTATIRQTSGLHTAPNPFSQVPEGALIVADEVTAPGPATLGGRRGMKPSSQFHRARGLHLPGTRL